MMHMGTGYQYVYVTDPEDGQAFLADAQTLNPLSQWVPAHRTAMLKYTPACKEVMTYEKWRELYLPKFALDTLIS